MVGLEQVLGGAPLPDIELPPLDHVSSEIDIFMEKPVHARRSLPLSSVADELAGMRPRRIAELRHLAATEDDPMTLGPVGERRMSVSLPIRAFDLWAHEQDIRRAVGLPVRIDCAAAEIAYERVVAGWAATLPAAVGGVDATIVVRRTDGTPSETRITLGDGGPDVDITGDLGELTRWFCGRVRPTSEMLGGESSLVEAVARATRSHAVTETVSHAWSTATRPA